MLQCRPAGFLGLRAREIHKPRPVIFAVQETARDHDLEQLSDTGRRRGIRQLGTDFLDGRALATVEDVHDLAFAPREMSRCVSGHRIMANYFAMREYIRHRAARQGNLMDLPRTGVRSDWLSFQAPDRTVGRSPK